VVHRDEEEAEDSAEQYTSCSPASSGKTGRRLARFEGVSVALLLLRLRTAR